MRTRIAANLFTETAACLQKLAEAPLELVGANVAINAKDGRLYLSFKNYLGRISKIQITVNGLGATAVTPQGPDLEVAKAIQKILKGEITPQGRSVSLGAPQSMTPSTGGGTRAVACKRDRQVATKEEADPI